MAIPPTPLNRGFHVDVSSVPTQGTRARERSETGAVEKKRYPYNPCVSASLNPNPAIFCGVVETKAQIDVTLVYSFSHINFEHVTHRPYFAVA